MITSTGAAYKAEITLEFRYKENENSEVEVINIEPSRLQYLIIDYRYESKNILPIIYISLKIPLDLHDKIINTYDISSFHLKITKKNMLATNSVAIPHIDDIFSYLCSNQEQNSAKNLNSNGTDDRSYISTSIGLISTAMTNNLRQSYNGFFNNVTAEQMIKQVALNGLGKKLIMSPLKYNDKCSTLIVPPTNSRYRLLQRIFEKMPFYDTTFTFFMDFDERVYLLDKTGNAVSDGKYSKIYINVTELDNSESMIPGIRYKKSDNGTTTLTLTVNAAQTSIDINDHIGLEVNNVVGYKYDEPNQNLSVTNEFMGSSLTPKQEFVYTENVAALKNDVVNSTVAISIFKQNIDSTEITPNKEYIITQTSNYEKYNGTYILYYKQEIYNQDGTGTSSFNVTCSAGFKRINSIEVAKASKDTSISVRKRKNKKTSKKKSSSDNVRPSRVPGVGARRK